MNQTSKNIIKVSHKSEWDARQVKIDLGLIDESWENFITNCRNLADVKVSNVEARSIIEQICLGDKDIEDAKWGHTKKVKEINHLYHYGLGNEYSYGTLWGVLNAFTEYGTYGKATTKQRDESTRFWDSAFGNLDKLKNDAYTYLLELA